MKRWMIGSIALGFLIVGVTPSIAGPKKAVSYPKGYRDWTHVKSMVIQAGHPLYESFGGIHHIYANDAAFKAMERGGTYPDGAVLVFDLLESKSEGNAIVEGPRKVVGVMERRTKDFPDTSGWGFEAFKGDTEERLVSDPKNACYGCHEPQKKTNYIFGTFRK